ncbi:hypothetical protein [Pseudomonas monteilii]|uniref:hypothetical protein n=1 Tax=Pseudomonas monteilii TaxID=76759 RepID=UPI001CBD54DD|nr:hypothetical protein [Pseudomonas monteilii]MBZ3664881.1 hypothetical protein [Pseudomonas monteilii]MBZ3670226.1 hypothetical protein [Pseudomonas monteilii]
MTEAVEWCTVVWQVVDGTKSAAGTPWDSFALALLTGAFGVLSVLIGQRNQARSQAKSVRAALLAEVSAICRQVASQEIVQWLNVAAAEIRKNPDPTKPLIQKVRVVTNGDVNKIYKANLAHLGGLSKKEAELIVRFHYVLEGAVSGVMDGGPLAEGRDDPTMFEGIAANFEEVMALGEELSRENTTGWWRRHRGQNVDTHSEGNAG